MRNMFNAICTWLAVALAPAALSACATVGMPTTTPGQSLYAAHANYNNVLGRFVSYAESPIASGGVVLQGKAINDKVRPAFRYSEAYIACTEKGKVASDMFIVAANVKCGDFRFDTKTVTANSSLLSSATSKLTGLLKAFIK